MNATSLSLLTRLRRAPNSKTWSQLVELYAPLLRVWLRKYDVQADDADDLVQEVLLAVSQDLKNSIMVGSQSLFVRGLRQFSSIDCGITGEPVAATRNVCRFGWATRSTGAERVATSSSPRITC